VIVTEGLMKEDFIAERCDLKSFEDWKNFVCTSRKFARGNGGITGVPAERLRAPRVCTPPVAMQRSITAWV
jgi:formate dehydrogenase major subunit